ncbi:NUDIX domain-containing protein [Candidatus Saccharibacteria bacterium]|nr:NUDIX domain-containing protein [Candidatus Saccharibacteria bacterium]
MPKTPTKKWIKVPSLLKGSGGNPIRKIVREPTAGGIVLRSGKNGLEVLLIQDAKNRWTVPKGHIEKGETARQAAAREIGEETGLTNIHVGTYLGKVDFKYRREDRLVLMSTQLFLVEDLGNNTVRAEKWMKGIRYMPFDEAVELIEYPDIQKLLYLAKARIRSQNA